MLVCRKRSAANQGDAEIAAKMSIVIRPSRAAGDEQDLRRLVASLARGLGRLATKGRANDGDVDCGPTHVLAGLLKCGRCGSRMVGRSGTGRLGTPYFYYVCENKDCRVRVPAEEIEGAVMDRIRQLAGDEGLCRRLVDEANKTLLKELPALNERRRTLMRNLNEVKAQADRTITVATAMSEEEGKDFLKEKLADLARRRTDLEKGIEEVDGAIAQAKRDQVKVETVQSALAKIGDLFGCLKPFEQKELMRLVVRSAEVSDRQIVLELYRTEYLQDENAPEIREAQSDLRFERTNWLPGLVPQSVLRDLFKADLQTLWRPTLNSHQMQAKWQSMLDDGVVRNRASLARRYGVSRARVTQVLGSPVAQL